MRTLRRLPLTGLVNARELGGFSATDSMVTKYGVFIRSEVPDRLTLEDIRFIKDYGIRTALDFRGGEECAVMRDKLMDLDWIRYIHLPIHDDAFTAKGQKMSVLRFDSDFSWGEHYIGTMENHKGWVRDVLTAMSEAEGAALFHCTTGKDRTGMITAALLGLCGVPDFDIIADYSVSQIYLRPMYLEMAKYVPANLPKMDLSDPFFGTSPANMEILLNHISKKYGGMRPYLASCGLGDDTLDKLKKRLLD